jgi:hypothetical protein
MRFCQYSRRHSFSKLGEIVKDKNESDGLPTNYIIKNPELIVFVDETGCNTIQKTDHKRGNEKRIVGTDEDTGNGLTGAVSDNHFTILCFQSGTGEPIICSIIFKSEIPDCWKTGIDIRRLRNEEILPGQDEEEIGRLYIGFETGENGALGGGPVCTFQVETIPTYCSCTPNASITSEILTDMLRRIDHHKVYDRENAEKPILILDGHHSRMLVIFAVISSNNKS